MDDIAHIRKYVRASYGPDGIHPDVRGFDRTDAGAVDRLSSCSDDAEWTIGPCAGPKAGRSPRVPADMRCHPGRWIPDLSEPPDSYVAMFEGLHDRHRRQTTRQKVCTHKRYSPRGLTVTRRERLNKQREKRLRKEARAKRCSRPRRSAEEIIKELADATAGKLDTSELDELHACYLIDRDPIQRYLYNGDLQELAYFDPLTDAGKHMKYRLLHGTPPPMWCMRAGMSFWHSSANCIWTT